MRSRNLLVRLDGVVRLPGTYVGFNITNGRNGTRGRFRNGARVLEGDKVTAALWLVHGWVDDANVNPDGGVFIERSAPLADIAHTCSICACRGQITVDFREAGALVLDSSNEPLCKACTNNLKG